MNVRLFNRISATKKMCEIHTSLNQDPPTVMEAFEYWLTMGWVGKAGAAFVLEHDPEETIWLVALPRYTTLERALAHESLHIALNRLGEKEASKAIDSLFFWRIRRRKMDDGGI